MEKTNIKTRLEVVKSETKNKLYLYGTIRPRAWWDEEGDDSFISADRVKKALEDVTGDIEIHINSGGGDVFESIAISNMLRQHEGNIEIVIDALAGSGASVIAMAGDSIKMYKNSMMMIHRAWTYAAGNSAELRKVAENLDKIDEAVAASYSERFSGTKEELETLLAAETWLTATDAVLNGLADELVEEEDKKAQDAPQSPTEATVEDRIVANLFEKYSAMVKAQKETKPTEPEQPADAKNLFDKFKKKGE